MDDEFERDVKLIFSHLNSEKKYYSYEYVKSVYVKHDHDIVSTLLELIETEFIDEQLEADIKVLQAQFKLHRVEYSREYILNEYNKYNGDIVSILSNNV